MAVWSEALPLTTRALYLSPVRVGIATGACVKVVSDKARRGFSLGIPVPSTS